MAVTAAQIAQLRRVVAEPLTTTYSDALLTTIIESYPTMDANGESPYIPAADANTWQSGIDALSLVVNTAWIGTWDLSAAAAQIWAEKAAVPAADYDFSADGATFHRSQVFEQCMKQARFYASKRKAHTITLKPVPYRRNTDDV